jgi:hypothetical protein
MAEVIDPVYGVAQWDEMIDNVPISATMFSQPVNNEQYCSRFTFRQPALEIGVGIPDTLEESFLVFHSPLLLLLNRVYSALLCSVIHR